MVKRRPNDDELTPGESYTRWRDGSDLSYIGRNIRMARERLGLSRRQLAERLIELGILPELSAWMRGVSPSAQIQADLAACEQGNSQMTLVRLNYIAEALHVEQAELLDPEGPKFGPRPLWCNKGDTKDESE